MRCICKRRDDEEEETAPGPSAGGPYPRHSIMYTVPIPTLPSDPLYPHQCPLNALQVKPTESK